MPEEGTEPQHEAQAQTQKLDRGDHGEFWTVGLVSRAL